MFPVNPTRRSQPFRQALGRPANPALSAMLQGRTFYGYNPQDMVRANQRKTRLSQMAAQRIGAR